MLQMGVLDNQSCPVCAFEKGSRGRPVPELDTMVCLDCGSRWKEVTAEGFRQPDFHKPQCDMALVQARIQPAPSADEVRIPNAFAAGGGRKLTGKGMAGAGFMLLIAFFAVMQLLPFTSFLFPTHNPETIEISRVELEERSSPAGGKVFIVKGSLSNHSDQPQRIPKIAIILKKNNGNEVLRWYHVSPKPVLSAGQNMRFASSVFHPATFVAYAEASLTN